MVARDTQTREPEGPTQLKVRSWKGVVTRTFREFKEDNLNEWAAALTYAILPSAEVDAELERGRRIETGHPADREPFVEPRDTKKLKDSEVKAS
jgi:hypothetical protein